LLGSDYDNGHVLGKELMAVETLFPMCGMRR